MSENSRSSRGAWQYVAGAVVLLALYVLSVGPAVWCMERGFISEQTLEMVYLPLIQITSLHPPTYWLLDEYATWWQ